MSWFSFPDVSSFLQSISVVSAIVGTLGLTTLAVSVYQQYVIAREGKRERFAKLVLTSDFFTLLSDFWRFDDICRAASEIKDKGRTVLSVDGKITELKTMSELHAESEKFFNHLVNTSRKVQEGGPFFLVPAHIRTPIGELGDFLVTLNFDSIDSSFLATYRTKLNNISKLIRKEVGLE